MIDTMVADLKKEQEDEFKHQEFCAKELSENEQQQSDTKDHISDLTADIEESSDKVETLSAEIAELQKQIAEMNVQLKRAGEDRVLANEEFQRTIQDQRATQLILNKVMKRLEKVYEAPPPPANATNATEGEAPAAEAPAAFLQRGLAHHEELQHKQMPSFGAYGKNDEGGGVVGLIAEIIRKASSLEAEATVAEQGAQNDYQAFVSETSKSIAAANRSISAKSDEKADLEESIVAAKSDKTDEIKKLMDLGKYESQLHTSCDYVLKNFEMRQTARQEEMDALSQAKAILHG